MRGQFIRGDGLVIPNNVSLAGADMILKAAFRLTAQPLFAALVAGTPTLSMTMATLTEPTIGTNGYARVAVAQSAIGWPLVGTLVNEKYIETDWLVFEAVGGNFNQPIQRIALLGFNTYLGTHDVFALSALMPAQLTVTPTTLLADRRFKYQFFL